MKIGGEYLFDGPRDLVWQTLLDPATLVRVLPGAEKLEPLGNNEYEAMLTLKVGPVQGQFQGRVKLENIQPPDGYTMVVDGRGAPGFVKATGNLRLAPEGERTRLSYDGDAQVGGRLASVGQRLVETSAKAIINQSLSGLNEVVKARAAAAAPAGGGAAPPPMPAVEPPSQAEFARKVAREVAKDLVPHYAGRVMLGVVVLILAVVVFLLLR
jgi:carbon monoxide dehydrogenase subunit G